jgi:hypothetical protein
MLAVGMSMRSQRAKQRAVSESRFRNDEFSGDFSTIAINETRRARGDTEGLLSLGGTSGAANLRQGPMFQHQASRDIALAAGATADTGFDINGEHFVQLSGNIERAQAALSAFSPELQDHYQKNLDAMEAEIPAYVRREERENALMDIRKTAAQEYVDSFTIAKEASGAAVDAIISNFGSAETSAAGLAEAIKDGFISASEAAKLGLDKSAVGMISSLDGVASAAQAAGAKISSGAAKGASGVKDAGNTMVSSFKAVGKEADSVNSAIQAINGKTVTVTTVFKSKGSPSGSGAGGTGRLSGTFGRFETVPPGFPNDSFSLGLSSGEKFKVMRSGESELPRADTGMDSQVLAAKEISKMRGDMNELIIRLIKETRSGFRTTAA